MSARDIAAICCSPPDRERASCRRRSLKLWEKRELLRNVRTHAIAVDTGISTQEQIFLDAHRAEQLASLRHKRETASNNGLRVKSIETAAVKVHSTVARRYLPHNGIEQGALTCAVGAENGNDLARVHS